MRYLYFIFFVVSFLTNAQQINYQLENYTITDGLSNQKVQSICKDKNGGIWIGTPDGLNYFDGTYFTVYKNNPHVYNSLSDGGISSIVEDKKGIIWVGIDGGGINLLNPKNGKIKKYLNDATNEENRTKYVKHIYIDSENIIWVSTWGGLLQYDEKNNKFLLHKAIEGKNSIIGEDVKKVIEDPQKKIWIATAYGLSCFDKKSGKFKNFRIKSYNSDNYELWIRDLFWDSNHNLWITTDSRKCYVYSEKNNSFYPIPIKNDFAEPLLINSIKEDRENNLWLATDYGIYTTSLKSEISQLKFLKSKISSEQNLNNNSLIIDENHIWFGTSNNGLFKYDYKKNIIGNILVNTPYKDCNYKSLFIHDNKIWFSVVSTGIIEYDLKTKEYKKHFLGANKISPEVHKLLKLNDDVWIGSQFDGLFRYTPKTKTTEHLLKEGKITDIAYYKNHVFVGSNSGLKIYNYQKEQFIDISSFSEKLTSLIDQYIIFVEVDSKNRLWISTSKGAYVFDLTNQKLSLIRYKTSTKLNKYNFICLAEDKKNNIYLGTGNGGLIKIDAQKRITNIYSNSSLFSNTITSIQIDNQNHLWVGTNKGVNLIKPKTPISIKHFNQADGFSNIGYNISSSTKDSLGNMYIAGDHGIDVFNPKQLKLNKPTSKAYLHELKINNYTINPNLNSYAFNHNENNFLFKFSTINFQGNYKTTFKYRLLGIDKKWNYTNNKNTVSYNNLPSGNFKLEVYAGNSFEDWSDKNIFYFKIKTPFWKTVWFISIITLSILSLISYLIIQRHKNLILQKENAQFKFVALSSQMNPHFIFNSLNSIQHFIIKNESDFALRYLSKFSKLVRRILENSNNEKTSLKDEITFLDNYLSVESLRFDNKLVYKINISEKIDTDSIEIPSLLIQPYVENSIIHGLMHLKNNPILTIDFILLDNKLKCTILDNGIGRTNSIKNNQKIKRKHHSIGMSITQKRLELLNKNEGIDVVIKITDVNNADQICGTCVELLIPIEYHT